MPNDVPGHNIIIQGLNGFTGSLAINKMNKTPCPDMMTVKKSSKPLEDLKASTISSS